MHRTSGHSSNSLGEYLRTLSLGCPVDGVYTSQTPAPFTTIPRIIAALSAPSCEQCHSVGNKAGLLPAGIAVAAKRPRFTCAHPCAGIVEAVSAPAPSPPPLRPTLLKTLIRSLCIAACCVRAAGYGVRCARSHFRRVMRPRFQGQKPSPLRRSPAVHVEL